MSESCPQKTFTTSWGVEYTVSSTNSVNDTTQHPMLTTHTETKDTSMKNIALIFIAVGLIAVCINFKSEQHMVTFEEGSTLYEQFPDSYENSSFNPANGYIGNTHER